MASNQKALKRGSMTLEPTPEKLKQWREARDFMEPLGDLRLRKTAPVPQKPKPHALHRTDL